MNKQKKQLITILIVAVVMGIMLYLNKNSIFLAVSPNTSYSISQKDVQNFFNASSTERGLALGNIINVTLKNLGLENWNEQKLKSIVVKGEMLTDKKNKSEDLIVAVSLLPDKGALGIYQKSGTKYTFYQGLNNLLPITSAKIINSEIGQSLVYLEENLNEQMGAFYNTVLAEMYKIDSGGLKLVFSTNKQYEADWNEAYDNKKNPSWLKLIENADINITDRGNLRIQITSNQKLLKSKKTSTSTTPVENDYDIIKSRTLNEVFYWDPGVATFIMGKALITADNVYTYNFDGLKFNKASKLNKGEIVSIIDDMANNVENLTQENTKYMLIMRKNGETSYVYKADIDILK